MEVVRVCKFVPLTSRGSCDQICQMPTGPVHADKFGSAEGLASHGSETSRVILRMPRMQTVGWGFFPIHQSTMLASIHAADHPLLNQIPGDSILLFRPHLCGMEE